MHKQMYAVLTAGAVMTGLFFDGASSWSLLQASCAPSRMATVLRTTVKQGMVTVSRTTKLTAR